MHTIKQEDKPNAGNRKITNLLLHRYGIDVSKYSDSFLERSVQKRIRETQSSSAETYYALIEQDLYEGEILFGSLNINYSEFFRNPLTFAILEKLILPSMVAKKGNDNRKEIRIWSAACAAGQEIYSLTMLVQEINNLDPKKDNFRIFATDQDESQVDFARTGQYPVSVLKNLSLKRVNQWFTKDGDSYFIKEELKKIIDFSVFDLFSDQLGCPPSSIFGDFNIVMCANLLFYYKTEFQLNILGKVGSCLARGGYLISGETERDILMKYGFEEVYPHSAIFQK